MKLTDPSILPTAEAHAAAREILLFMADKKRTDQLYETGPAGDAARLEWRGLHSLAFGKAPQTGDRQ